MTNINISLILGIVIVCLLIKFWRRQNIYIWQGVLAGLVTSAIVEIIYFFQRNEINWLILENGIIFGAAIGLISQLFMRFYHNKNKV